MNVRDLKIDLKKNGFLIDETISDSRLIELWQQIVPLAKTLQKIQDTRTLNEISRNAGLSK